MLWTNLPPSRHGRVRRRPFGLRWQGGQFIRPWAHCPCGRSSLNQRDRGLLLPPRWHHRRMPRLVRLLPQLRIPPRLSIHPQLRIPPQLRLRPTLLQDRRSLPRRPPQLCSRRGAPVSRQQSHCPGREVPRPGLDRFFRVHGSPFHQRRLNRHVRDRCRSGPPLFRASRHPAPPCLRRNTPEAAR